MTAGKQMELAQAGRLGVDFGRLKRVWRSDRARPRRGWNETSSVCAPRSPKTEALSRRSMRFRSESEPLVANRGFLTSTRRRRTSARQPSTRYASDSKNAGRMRRSPFSFTQSPSAPLKPFVDGEGKELVTQRQVEMTCDVMAHSLLYWTQGLLSRDMMREGGRIYAMTSTGSSSIWKGYGAVSAAKKRPGIPHSAAGRRALAAWDHR